MLDVVDLTVTCSVHHYKQQPPQHFPPSRSHPDPKSEHGNNRTHTHTHTHTHKNKARSGMQTQPTLPRTDGCQNPAGNGTAKKLPYLTHPTCSARSAACRSRSWRCSFQTFQVHSSKKSIEETFGINCFQTNVATKSYAVLFFNIQFISAFIISATVKHRPMYNNNNNNNNNNVIQMHNDSNKSAKVKQP